MSKKKKYVIPWSIYLGILIGFELTEFLLNHMGIEFRLWVLSVFWLLRFLFPAVTIGFYLMKIKHRTTAIALTAVYGILAAAVFFISFFVYLLKAPEEYHMDSGVICVSEQKKGQSQSQYTYWDSVSFFARKQFQWDSRREIELLEEKYNLKFVPGETEKEYIPETYPDIRVHILNYPTPYAEVQDDFLNNLGNYYFEKTYKEKGFTGAYVLEEYAGKETYFLIVKDWESLQNAADEASKMIKEALQDSIFQKYSGCLWVRIELARKQENCQLDFGGMQESEEGVSGDYYSQKVNVRDKLQEVYNRMMESLSREKMLEQGSIDSEQRNKAYWNDMGTAFNYLFEEELSAEFPVYEERYNAKGNFYAVLSKDGGDFDKEENRVVYDRVSDDGEAQLFVQFKGEAIVTGYSVNVEEGIIEKYDVNW